VNIRFVPCPHCKEESVMLASYEGQCGLTKREAEICDLLCEGKRSKEIAERFGVTTEAVKFHRRNVLNKVGCDNSLNLVLYAWQMAHAV
jgi:DNA-binding CsgD family transcriptional regulator